MESVGMWVEQKMDYLMTISDKKLLKQRKCVEKFLNVSLRQFRLLLNRIFIFEVTVSHIQETFGPVEVFGKI
jgi:hypothetical protein